MDVFEYYRILRMVFDKIRVLRVVYGDILFIKRISMGKVTKPLPQPRLRQRKALLRSIAPKDDTKPPNERSC